ncbi:hypothetical protein [Nocardia nepalensis]|uniref:WXG100-like domain-containing protein n=1 Tax=Nocardia nepalensis TaxID=3375448 RepID=UPI003B675A26
MSNDGITELWDWIPHWILSALNFFQGYPDGHQGDLFDLGDDWHWAGDALKDLKELLKDVTDETYKWYEDGEGAEQIKKEFDSLFTGPASVDKTAEGLHDLGKYTRHGGTEIEFTKMMDAVFAGITTRAVIALLPEWPWGDALIPVVIGIGRAVLGAFSREALGKLAAAAAETTLKNILEKYVKQIAIQTLKELATKQGLEQLALAAGKAGLQGAAIDAGIQGLQIVTGHRDDGFDLKQTLRTGLEWGAGGLLGAPVGMAVGNAMAKAALSDAVRTMGHDNPWARALLRPEVRSMTSGVFGGALGGSVGMYGAGIAWQVGEHLANPNDPNYKGIDWTFHPGLIAAGAGMGALHGVAGGSEQRVQVLAASENMATARADGSAARPAPPMVEATARSESAKVVDRIGKTVDTAGTPEQRERQAQAYQTAKEIYGTESVNGRPVSEMERLSALQRLEASTSPSATNASAGASAGATGSGQAGASAAGANSSGSSSGTAEPRTAAGTPERGAGSPERTGARPPTTGERNTSRAGAAASENRDHAANLDAGKQESAPMTREELRASAAEAREEIRATAAEAREEIRTSATETRNEIRASAADLREEIRSAVDERRAESESASEPRESHPDGESASRSKDPRPDGESGSTPKEPRPGDESGSTPKEPRPGDESGSTPKEPRPGDESASTRKEPRPGDESASTRKEPRPGDESGSTPKEPRPDNETEHGRKPESQPDQRGSAPEPGRDETRSEQRGSVGESESGRAAGESGREGETGPRARAADAVPSDPGAVVVEPRAAASERTGVTETETSGAERRSGDGSSTYVEERPAPHPEPARASEPAATVNTCVADALQWFEQAQQRPVLDGPMPEPRSLAGVPLSELRTAVRGEFEGFVPRGSSRPGHAQIVKALMDSGRGSSALVVEQRARANEGGAGAHAYAVTYLGEINGFHTFEVNGERARYTGTDRGKEWFRDATGKRKSLAELAGGARRADAVATEAVIMRDGEVVSGLGHPDAARLDGDLMVGAKPSRRAELTQLHSEVRAAITEEARARGEATRLREQAQQARADGLDQRANRLDEQVRLSDEQADAAHEHAQRARDRVVELENATLTEEYEAQQARIDELHQQLTDTLGSPEEVQQFRADLEKVDNLDAALQQRDRVQIAQREVHNLEQRVEHGRTAVRELEQALQAAEAKSADTPAAEAERKAAVRAARLELVRAEHGLEQLERAHTRLTDLVGTSDELIERRDALTQEISEATRARDRLAASFDVHDPVELSARYRGELSPGAEQVHELRDTIDRVRQAEAETDRITERRAGLRALDEAGLLPISDRVGVVPAAEPSRVFPYERIVVVGSETDPAAYRQALQRALRTGTDVELLMRLAKSDKIPMDIEFMRVVLDEQVRPEQTTTDPVATEKAGARPDPAKHPRPWEKTKWTEPQPPFLFKVSMVPVFDEIMSPLHHFSAGEVPEFIYPENLPFSKSVFDVPDGVHAYHSDVGMYAFHLRILSLGIIDRVPNHPWVRDFVQNRPWIGKAVLSATKWLPANVEHGRGIHLPLSVEFVNKHPRVAWALGGVAKWIPSVTEGRWIQLLPGVRGTRTHAWFDHAQADPQPLVRRELTHEPTTPGSPHLDGSAVRPYSGESVHISESFRARSHANDAVRERIQEWTEHRYDAYEHNRVHEGDSNIHRIADEAAKNPDRYSGGDAKRWVRGSRQEWIRDPDGATLAKHPDGSTWLRDGDGNVRPRAEIEANLRRARDYLMRNPELNRIADVAEMWDRLIDGKPLREDVIGLEAALAGAEHLALDPDATTEQAHRRAKELGYDWDANRPHLTGDRADRSLWGKLTGRRATTVGFTVELDPNAPDAARTRRFGTTAYYGRQGFDQVNGQIRDIMRGWPEAKIAEAQAEVTRMAREATRDYRGDHGLAKGGVHISARVTGEAGHQRLSVTVEHEGGGRPKDPTSYRLDQSDRGELPPGKRGTAAPVGEFRGDARAPGADPLTRNELVDAIRDNLGLITPDEVAWNRDGQHFVLPDGREVHLEVGETRDGAVAEFRERSDGSGYDVIVSSRARSQDVARAVAHELAEIRLAEDPAVLTDPVSERPAELTSHLGGRFAELKVLAAHIDRAAFDPARAGELPGLRQDMADLMDHLGLREGPEAADRWALLDEHDPGLARRLQLGLGTDGLFGARPVFDRTLTDSAFDDAHATHLDRLEQQLAGEFAPDVVRAESMALDGRMREEQARRIFDPIFAGREGGAARKTIPTKQLLRALDPINEAINSPGLSASERAHELHSAIEGFRDAMPQEFRNALGPEGFERMHSAADALANGPDRIAGVLDHAHGEVSVGTERMSLSDFLHGVDRANRGAAEHGVNLEYAVVVHDPVEGRSAVEVLPRPRPQHRLPLEQNRFGEDNHQIVLQPRPSVPAAEQGRHTIDVGVGRSAFAVEMTPAADRAGGGLVIKTELADDFAVAGQRRRNLGILDPGPLTEPGTVMVFGDLLSHGGALGDGETGAVARVFINNVSAKFPPEFEDRIYDGIAKGLAEGLAPGGRIELQWDMKPEKPFEEGGTTGDRGHIRGDHLWAAIRRLPPDVAGRFRIAEDIEFPYPGNENYDYTIDAGASNKLNTDKMAEFVPPRPDHRMIITYEPHEATPVDGRHGTAAPVGEFHGAARPAEQDSLTHAELMGEVGNNLGLITPDEVAWNRDGQHFVLPDGREVHLEVGETRDGAVAEFRERSDGSGYDVIVSSRARSQDVARAVAHELAEIRLAEDPAVLTDPVSERPAELTSHLGGRFAELKVLAAHIDRAAFDPARAGELPGLRQDMADLMDHLGLREDATPERSPHPDSSDPWALLAAHDPALAHRLALGFGTDGLLSERPVFNRDLTAPAFEEASAAHLDRMAGALTGDFASDVVRAESMALHGRMREELARRVFDPIFTDPGAGEARRTVRTGQLLRALDPINEAINRPGLHGVERADAVHRAIDGFRDAMPEEFRNALGTAGFERMHLAADGLSTSVDHIAGVLDHAHGEVSVGTERMSLSDFLHGVDRANRGAAEHGVNLEYAVVVHDPVEGRSAVEVLPRPRPQHRLPLEQNRFGEENHRIPLQPRPSLPAAERGGHTVDVGVGRSAFGVEMTPAADRAGGGLVIKTELADDFAVAGQRRRNLGILDPGPLTEPGTVTVFGDLLFHGDALGDGRDGAVARIFVNNVSAHFEPAVYDALAQRLSAVLAPGGRIELQWDMKPEKAVELGGTPGDRGHIRGDHLWDAIQRLPEELASRFHIVEAREFPHPGNENYDYTIDAGASNKLDANKMAQFVPPRPDHRMVIAYEPHQTEVVEGEHGTAGNVGEFRGDARPEDSLTRNDLLDEVVANVQLITPEGISWNPEQEHFVVRGKEIHLDVVPPRAGVVSEFHAQPDGSYRIEVSSGARTEDAARAVGHELAEIQLAEQPEVVTDPISERPPTLTSHLGGRFAELKVLAAHIDRATFDPTRADELPELRRDLADLLNHLGMSERPPVENGARPADPWTLLREHDGVLAHRLALGLGADGLLSERPRFDRTLTEADFDAARAAHLDRLEQQLTGAHAPEVVRAEAMALDGRMREEQVRRIFDPIFADPQGWAEIRRTVPIDQLFKALDPINAAINRPGASASAVHQAIEGLRASMPEAFREALGDNGFDRMHRAADALTSGPDRITGVLDHARGAVLVGDNRLSFNEFLHDIDRANRGADEDGLNLEYAVVVHDPVDGHSAVEVLPRPRPHHRLPMSELVFGADNHTIPPEPRPSLPEAVAGAHTIDVGVGRSAFGVEMTPAADRSGGGLIIKTELTDDFVIKGQRRREFGILDPGPLTAPGAVMVFGNMLFHGDALAADETGTVARIYINNVSAELKPADYRALAARLPAVLAPGGRIEVQWDMKPEADGGKPGDRNHILGTELWNAITELEGGQGAHFTVVEEKEFPYPGNRNYYYSIDAGSRSHVGRASLAKFNPPQPDHRMVIVYDPAGRGYGRTDQSDTAGIGAEVRRR